MPAVWDLVPTGAQPLPSRKGGLANCGRGLFRLLLHVCADIATARTDRSYHPSPSTLHCLSVEFPLCLPIACRCLTWSLFPLRWETSSPHFTAEHVHNTRTPLIQSRLSHMHAKSLSILLCRLFIIESMPPCRCLALITNLRTSAADLLS